MNYAIISTSRYNDLRCDAIVVHSQSLRSWVEQERIRKNERIGHSEFMGLDRFYTPLIVSVVYMYSEVQTKLKRTYKETYKVKGHTKLKLSISDLLYCHMTTTFYDKWFSVSSVYSFPIAVDINCVMSKYDSLTVSRYFLAFECLVHVTIFSSTWSFC